MSEGIAVLRSSVFCRIKIGQSYEKYGCPFTMCFRTQYLLPDHLHADDFRDGFDRGDRSVLDVVVHVEH